MPEAYSGESFCKKFKKIERALGRKTVEYKSSNQNQINQLDNDNFTASFGEDGVIDELYNSWYGESEEEQIHYGKTDEDDV